MSDGFTSGPIETLPANDGGKQIAFVVYILYFVGFFLGLTALAGVIVAHLKVKEASPVFQTHFRYQIRTFWIGVLMLLLGGALSLVLIGYLLLLFWLVWTLVRCIKGVMRVNEARPIDNPGTWLW